MQVLGTVNIGQNIEIAQNCEINNFQNSSQHKSTANVQPQIATPAETNSQATCPEVKPIVSTLTLTKSTSSASSTQCANTDSLRLPPVSKPTRKMSLQLWGYFWTRISRVFIRICPKGHLIMLIQTLVM